MPLPLEYLEHNFAVQSPLNLTPNAHFYYEHEYGHLLSRERSRKQCGSDSSSNTNYQACNPYCVNRNDLTIIKGKNITRNIGENMAEIFTNVKLCSHSSKQSHIIWVKQRNILFLGQWMYYKVSTPKYFPDLAKKIYIY